MNKLKKTSLFVQIIGYMMAGANHFRSPASYIKIIPSYFPHPEILNISAGICEIGFAIMLIFTQTRRFAAWGIILMLIAFIPVYIQTVAEAPFILSTLKVTPLLAWLRLVVLQPMLILWAWWYTDSAIKKKN